MGKKGRARRAGRVAPADLPIALFADSPDGRRVSPGKAVAAGARELDREQVPDHWGEMEEDREEGRVVVTRAPTVATRGWRGRREYRRLPIDFWHLLSNYIPPEKVAPG